MRGLRYQPVTVVNYGDDVVDEFGHRGRVEIGRHDTYANLQQRTSSEQLTSGQVTVLYDVFLPPTEYLDAGDEVEAAGQRFQVLGAPLAPRNGRGVHHVEATLRYVGSVDVPPPAGG